MLFILLSLASSAAQAAGAQYDRAQCLVAKNSHAADACRRFTQCAGRNVLALLELGRELEQARHLRSALTVYEQGLKIHNNHRDLLRRKVLVESDIHELDWQKQNRKSGSYADGGAKEHRNLQARLDAIKCKRLQGAEALAACQSALLVDGNNAVLQKNRQHASKPTTGLPASIDPASKNIAAVDTDHISKANNVAIPNSVDKYKQSPPAERLIKTSVLPLVEQMKLLAQLRKERLISKQDFQRRKLALLDNTFQETNSATAVSTAMSAAELTRGLNLGRFHALVIGNNSYKGLPRLKTAIADAKAIASTLRSSYGFSVKTLIDASRYDILKELSRLRASLSKQDNLLIYYAGHGYVDEATGRGYWLPVDAEEDNFANWISTNDITDVLNGMNALHVLVVADSCYSGTLTRGGGFRAAGWENDRRALIQRLVSKRSRKVLSSGGIEPVLDSGGGEHSVFTKALLDVLQENLDVMEGNRLFLQLRERVVLNADQTPEYADIRKAGHEGGDFIFVRRK